MFQSEFAGRSAASLRAPSGTTRALRAHWTITVTLGMTMIACGEKSPATDGFAGSGSGGLVGAAGSTFPGVSGSMSLPKGGATPIAGSGGAALGAAPGGTGPIGGTAGNGERADTADSVGTSEGLRPCSPVRWIERR